jgi:putative transposase
MTWTPEHRRRYAPAINDMVRASALVRLAAMIDAIDPPARTGRPRLWSSLIVLQALWWLCRAGSAWCLLPAVYPPRQTVGSRLDRWMRRGVLDRALVVLNGCLRLARGRKRRPSAGILDTQSVKTGPQRGLRGYDAGKKVPPGPPCGPVPLRGPDRWLCHRWQEARAAGRYRGPRARNPGRSGIRAGPRHTCRD